MGSSGCSRCLEANKLYKWFTILYSMWYLCKSGKELSIDEMRGISFGLGGVTSYIGQVDGEDRWDYGLEKDSRLTSQDRSIILSNGLEIVIDDI